MVLIFPPKPPKECVKVSHVIFDCRVINHHRSDVRKFEKIEISQSTLKLKLEIMIDRDSNMRAFTYDVCSNLGVSK